VLAVLKSGWALFKFIMGHCEIQSRPRGVKIGQ
jgi:hypothetical protein